MPYATRRILTDNLLIPTGELHDNKRGQAFDFWSKPKQLGKDLNKPVMQGACGYNCTGYDTAFLFDGDGPPEWEKVPVATLASKWSGIQVDVFTDQAAYQIYSCNNMNGTPSTSMSESASYKLTRIQAPSRSSPPKASSTTPLAPE